MKLNSKVQFVIIHKLGMSETVGGKIANNHQKQTRVHNDGPKQQQPPSPSQCCGKFFFSLSDTRIIGWWLCSSAASHGVICGSRERICQENKCFLSSQIRNTVYLLAEKNTKGILVVDCILLLKCGKC